MKNLPVIDDNLLLGSPAVVWQGMSFSEIQKEICRLKKRQNIISNFTNHLKLSSTCDFGEYEKFCDLISTEGVDPILWIECAIENVEYAIDGG
jgi:hypothetical protein